MRAAMIGGAAYAVGKHAQRGNDAEAYQEARLDELEAQQQQQQYQAPPPPPAPTGGGAMSGDAIEELKKLASLRDEGILTETEFQDQKRKLLGG
jgi:hypothetical protein